LRSFVLRFGLPAGLAFATLAAEAPARADVKACLGAHEKGQQARSSGRLREAREQFLVCAADGCPGAVRTDCARWADDLSNRLPSIVIGAKDRGSRDLFDVKVSLDGTPLVEKLDGKSIVIDPGPHTFKFEAAGMPTVSQKVLVKEGDRARPVEVVFDGGAPVPARAKPEPTAGPAPKKAPETQAEKSSGAGVLPWILVGVGGVGVVGGVVYALTAPALPTGCDSTRGTCTRLTGESDDAFAARRDQAGKHDTQGKTGFVIAGAGGVVLVGGLVWVLIASASSSSASKTSRTSGASTPLFVTPWVGQGSGGFAAAASF
jgi:hypothetical protein